MKRSLVYAALFVLVVALVFSVQPLGQAAMSFEGNTIFLTCNSLTDGTLVAESSDSPPPITPDGDPGGGDPPDN